MFSNPDTLWIEILVIVAVVAFIGTLLAIYIYKKVHHLPTGECACCHKSESDLVKKYHKYYSKH